MPYLAAGFCVKGFLVAGGPGTFIQGMWTDPLSLNRVLQVMEETGLKKDLWSGSGNGVHGLPCPSSTLHFLNNLYSSCPGLCGGGGATLLWELRKHLRCDGGLGFLTEDLAGRPLPTGGMLLPSVDPSTVKDPTAVAGQLWGMNRPVQSSVSSSV